MFKWEWQVVVAQKYNSIDSRKLNILWNLLGTCGEKKLRSGFYGHITNIDYDYYYQ
jgi:hypothetical protein